MPSAVRVLNVAEKPSVAKEASRALSRGGARRRNSSVPGAPACWDFAYTVQNVQCDMVFTSVAGHLMSTDFREPYNKWRACAPLELYDAPLRRFVPEDKKKLERNLIAEARRAQWVILWLDCDREGEHICFEVLEVCQGANAGLRVLRAQFSTLLERDLRHALDTLREPNVREAEAVDARQEIDLRSGASFSRFLTMSLQTKFDWNSNVGPQKGDKSVISYGPCQFPTLGFIVKRQWEIYAHIPEEFWFIHVQYRNDETRQICDFEWERTRVFDKFVAEVLFEPCASAGLASVESNREKPVYRWPPHPLSTIEFAKRASSYLRIGSQDAMRIAEDLYQAGYISYPRTETDIFSQDFDLRAIVAEQQGHPQWGAYATNLLDQNSGLWRRPPGGGHDDKAHPPIHPTKFTAGEASWDNRKKRVYEFVVRHFLACCSERAIGSECVIRINVGGEKFSTRGVSIKHRNWLDVYPYTNWRQASLPDLSVGQTFAPSSCTLKGGHTRPAEKLKETDLIAKMEEHGIGTDATMAQHIQTTLNRGYAIREEQTMQFSPTPFGEALVFAYKEMGLDALWQPLLRAETETQVSSIAAGQVTKTEVIASAVDKTRAHFLKALPQLAVLERSIGNFFTRREGAPFAPDPTSVDTASVVRERCPLCDQKVVLVPPDPPMGYLLRCSLFPSCNHKVVLPRPTLRVKILQDKCPRCPSQTQVSLMDLKFRRAGIPFGFDTELLAQCVYCSPMMKDLFEQLGMAGASTARRTNHAGNGGRGGGMAGRGGHRQPQGNNSMTRPAPGGPLGNRQPKRRQNFGGSRAGTAPYSNNTNNNNESHTFVSATGQAFPLQNSRHQNRQYPSSNQNNSTCYHCGEMGHWARDCPNKPTRRR